MVEWSMGDMNESDENNDESRGLEGMEVSVAGAWQWQLADNPGPNMGRVERSHRPSPACIVRDYVRTMVQTCGWRLTTSRYGSIVLCFAWKH